MRLTERQKQYNKAVRKIDSLIGQAIRECETKGYRENLGYDSQNKLQDYLNSLDNLTYHDKAEIIKLFYSLCATI